MYRILTEAKNVEQIKAVLRGFGLDFTLFPGVGSWRGQEERSVAVELDNVSHNAAEQVAQTIKSMNDQAAILLQEFPVRSKLI